MSLLTRETPARLATVTSVGGCSMNTKVDPTGTARGHRHSLSDYAPWITVAQACLIIAMLIMAVGVMCRCRPAQGADRDPAVHTLPPGSSLTFEEAVKIAITQSPYFNSGEVFVGLLGSAQRINYTIIGDNANLASRLQDLTKTYQWPILISESTYDQVKDEFEAELADSVFVKGRSEAIRVYRLIGRRNALEAERIQPWDAQTIIKNQHKQP